MISIIMPMYNSSQFILETLNSIKAQTFLDFECLIIDDGSEDDSKIVVQNFLKNDVRFQLFDRPGNLKKGPSSCRNFGCTLAKGSFLQFFDSDDLMHPEHLQLKIETIQNYDFVVCKLQEFSKNFDINNFKLEKISAISNPINFFEDFVTGNFEMMMVAPLWRKTEFLKHLSFNENLHILEDHELYARILFKNNNGFFIDKTLIYYRQSQNSAMNSFYNSIGFGIDSYLEAKKTVLSLTKSKTIKLAILKMILGIMRMGLAQKEYQNCEKCFDFIKIQNLDFSINLKLKLLRIKTIYQFCKIVGKGDTYFKKLLKL
jgi:glycosyltransferase involved in cell wall biosynthesis